MKVTKVFFNKFKKGNMLGFASVTLADGEDEITITGIRLMQGPKGMFIGFPSNEYVDKESGEKKYKDICFPTTGETRGKIQNAIVSKYKNVNGNSNEDVPKKGPRKSHEPIDMDNDDPEDLPF
jgi:DNA-binding cell septation regulator SpoVG